MGKIQGINVNLSASDSQFAAKKRRYRKTLDIRNNNGVDMNAIVSSQESFDGKKWYIHDDNVCLTIGDLGEYNDNGEWEPNPDCMDAEKGTAWITFTPQQARAFARKLLTLASKCRTADEVDRDDPELIETCASSQRQLQKAWDSETPEKRAQAERNIREFEDLLPPELRGAWVK